MGVFAFYIGYPMVAGYGLPLEFRGVFTTKRLSWACEGAAHCVYLDRYEFVEWLDANSMTFYDIIYVPIFAFYKSFREVFIQVQ